jgi:subtilisin family serine protease
MLLAGILLALLGAAIGLVAGYCSCTAHAAAAPATTDELASNLARRTPLDARYIAPDPYGTLRATDRLNIALKDSMESLQALAEALGSKFTGEGYGIGHRDAETGRLQFLFPGGDCEAMKQRIREALPEFRLLIWDESIFGWAETAAAPAPAVGSLPWHLRALHAPEAWTITRGDPELIVAVLDDGFDTTHAALRGRYVRPYNVRTGLHAVSAGADNWHGTHVAGLVAGEGTGIAPDCKVLPIQLAMPGEQPTVTDVIDGVLYAMKNGARVINMSLARVINPAAVTEPPDSTASPYSDEELFWNELFATLDERGITMVMAAGNQGIPVGLDPMQRHPHTIKVSAVDSLGRLAAFSNYGPSTVPAPGVQVLSCMAGGGWTRADGTSMAAPLVAGIVALVRDAHPGIVNAELVRLFLGSGNENGRPAPMPYPAALIRSRTVVFTTPTS